MSATSLRVRAAVGNTAVGNKRDAVWPFAPMQPAQAKNPRRSYSPAVRPIPLVQKCSPCDGISMMSSTNNTEKGGTQSTDFSEVSNSPERELFDVVANTMLFIADAEAPAELLHVSMTSKSFRAAALSNIVWKELCSIKWRAKFGYKYRMERAENEEAAMAKDDGREFWYRQYQKELKLSTMMSIDLHELQNFTWSGCRWFKIPHRKYPAHLRSGLKQPVSNNTTFDDDFVIRGGDREGLYCLEAGGAIVNAAGPNGERCPARTLHVHRLSTWGWELRSQYFVLRSVDETGVDGLWDDYKKELTIQFKEEGAVSIRNNGDEIESRSVPSSMVDVLEW